MNQAKLPMNIPESEKTNTELSPRREDVRVRHPVRNQAEMMVRDLESLVVEDHPVRAVWAFLEGLDLSAFYSSIKVRIDGAGRPASDPQVLLALWIYATVEGIGSARELDRLCNEHDAYRWLRGGVPVDYHILADFRIRHREALDELLTRIVGTLMANDLVKLNCVAQDGIKVRASAGAGSFHRRGKLEECMAEAARQVKRLEEKNPDPEISRRRQAARERTARERVSRIRKALDQMASVEAAKERQKQTLAISERKKITEARVSTTDPEVRVMKMPDGGWRPAYNVQLATDVGSGVIVGVDVVQGNDAGQSAPMEDQISQRSGVHPEAYLMDGGFAQHDDITTLEGRQITVYAPVRPPRTQTSGRKSSTPRTNDSPAVVAWRRRMETEEAKSLYKMRAATAEWANAQVRCHGLLSFTVRGLDKVLSIVLLVAIAHNILRGIALVV